MKKSKNDNQSENSENGNESFEEKECGLCQDIPDSVIYLSCEHIVCLVCAAKLIFQEKEMEELDLSEIKCGTCGEITELSEEVQESIIEFLNNGVQDGDLEFEEEEEEEQD